MEPGGRVRWQATQESFLTAEKHVQTISLSSPGQYLIRDQFAGHTVAVGQADVPTQADSSAAESANPAEKCFELSK